MQLALKAGVFYDKVSNVTIWGNHSTTQVIEGLLPEYCAWNELLWLFYDMTLTDVQVPDFLNAKIDGVPVKEVVKDHKWLEEEFTEKVQKVKFVIGIHS